MDVISKIKLNNSVYHIRDERVDSTTYKLPSGGIPKSDLDYSVRQSISKADTALQSFTETDPTVPSWAKEPEKPEYTASEITNSGSNVAADLAAIAARIDQIVGLADGSTTGDAELQDIRVKTDGEVASSAGAAVREQISALKSYIDESISTNNEIMSALNLTGSIDDVIPDADPDYFNAMISDVYDIENYIGGLTSGN